MSVQTNFRAVDMIGAAKPAEAKVEAPVAAKPAAKPAPKAAKIAPVAVEEVVAVEAEASVDAPIEE